MSDFNLCCLLPNEVWSLILHYLHQASRFHMANVLSNATVSSWWRELVLLSITAIFGHHRKVDDQAIRGMKNLRYLDLRENNMVTDEGLCGLQVLKDRVQRDMLRD